ncbi:MAG: hypothetical protein IT529_09960 [Burkholderiales bacterium]|nr:hypothetical protein [Burkholderiales bacterium]
MDDIRKVMVVGSGVMGTGVLSMFAAAGFECTLLTRDPTRVRDVPGGVRVVGVPPKDPPDLVIENVPEDLHIKQQTFRRLDDVYRGRAILASNASSLPLQAIADVLSHPEAFCGIHYYQPPDAFDYVELISVEQTSSEVVERATSALARTGKKAIHLRKPVIGHLLNRLQHALLHEAFFMIEQGIIDAQGVDLLAKNLLGPRMCVTGLIEQKDIAGLEATARSQQGVVPHLHHGSEPVPMLQKMVEDGMLGVRSGRGFYDWSGRDVDAVRRDAADKLSRILDIIREPAR